MSERRCPRCAGLVDPRDRFCEKCGAPVTDQRRDRVEVDVRVAAAVSDRGHRHYRNEDALALRSLGSPRDGVTAAVAIVCDGVSSVTRPDEASEAAAQTGAEAMVAALHAAADPATATRAAVRAANQAVTDLADDGPRAQEAGNAGAGRAPACTFVSAVVTGRAVTVGWVGDSRAYWIPRSPESTPPARLTEDDSWLAQRLAAGTLTLADAADRRAHAITAWLGQDVDQVVPHVVTVEPACPGVVVVCTDGLWNYLDKVEELAAALPAQAGEAPLQAARELVEVALHRGGRDNVTVAVLPFDTRPFDTRPLEASTGGGS
ncbi:MAG: protein phosphatase 2C domain-containing protein [Actinomycetota bacterium]|nr:protein phosphatase 2C domain-containing protein [Actinomycetota bacterium]